MPEKNGRLVLEPHRASLIRDSPSDASSATRSSRCFGHLFRHGAIRRFGLQGSGYLRAFQLAVLLWGDESDIPELWLKVDIYRVA